MTAFFACDAVEEAEEEAVVLAEAVAPAGDVQHVWACSHYASRMATFNFPLFPFVPDLAASQAALQAQEIAAVDLLTLDAGAKERLNVL